ncbi:Phosphatidylglycerol/phosphatidylinositol transfer protein [Gloeophyllum trabeum ATCC 11539]|uniref:Phosphatidylglycerol/phosphatidylinositol transfer protein n=1 Tax=Gloeophyllum trabeum (strain ATCC 11539 / FP-39264 / Madison 617) TaxID=670483 RepID=S7QMP8_GLOTA|nr:Phosphatidylglycerol/phosphatidylinositol transfer protein [Gloeophyllum trabeum ATCC 11539]EPQ60743.1 Phosphatidylglycerol/phosphatidylinositol transfer protein [Gloeophyllum trabeum ATCC 11539]
MTRLSLLATLALAFTGIALATPLDVQEALVPSDGTVRISESWDYSVCGADTDAIQIKSIDVSPDPPKPGSNMTVNVKAYVQEVIEEGAYVDVVVKMGYVKLLSKSFDICEEARKAEASVQCPVQKGDYEVEQVAELPKEIPPGKFVVNVRGYTADDDDMVCVDLNVDFRKKPFFKMGW